MPTSPSFLRILQADIVKQIWAELPKHMSTPVAPLDEEMLSELAKVPAVVEGALEVQMGICWVGLSKPCNKG